MTQVTTSNFIFLGNFTDIDTDESDWDAENGGALLGQYNNTDMQNVAVTQHDTDHDGNMMDDEYGGSDYTTYNTGSGQVTAKPDTSAWYNAVVTDTDGVQHTVQLVIVQMDNGDTFVADYAGSDDIPLANIQTLELTSEGNSDYAGYMTGREVDQAPVCFASGTMIETGHGNVAIETLMPGCKVMTLDHGLQPLRWIGSMMVLVPRQHAAIAFAPSSLDKGIPAHTLMVSPQHRIMVSSKIAKRVTGTDEVLIPAKRFLDLDGVSQLSGKMPVQYWHLLFDTHQIVLANGVPCESLLLGPQAQKTLSAAAQAEIAALLPETLERDMTTAVPAELARPVPTSKHQKQLVQRHSDNQQPVLQTYPSTRV
ncbi:Hint domain-containing protein [Algirhabdus cladophorae]|uniref:Hint domain-containing protein n=1 Tax=Algirhabdus cladophorae TaxID=3377108 RepID=UPI003B847E6C